MQPAPAAPAPAAAKDRHDPAETLLSARSPHNYADTVARIERMAAERGLTVFARIDHAAEARKVGMTMPPTLLLIVGNPTGGTPMMLAQPSSAIDLPLKVLIQQFGDGKVGVTINSAKLLQHRHGLTEEQTRPAAALQGLVDAALR